MKESTFGAVLCFGFACLIITLIGMMQTMADVSNKLDEVQRVNEVQNGFILELLHKDVKDVL